MSSVLTTKQLTERWETLADANEELKEQIQALKTEYAAKFDDATADIQKLTALIYKLQENFVLLTTRLDTLGPPKPPAVEKPFVTRPNFRIEEGADPESGARSKDETKRLKLNNSKVLDLIGGNIPTADLVSVLSALSEYVKRESKVPYHWHLVTFTTQLREQLAFSKIALGWETDPLSGPDMGQTIFGGAMTLSAADSTNNNPAKAVPNTCTECHDSSWACTSRRRSRLLKKAAHQQKSWDTCLSKRGATSA